jgi:hypothetical protein
MHEQFPVFALTGMHTAIDNPLRGLFMIIDIDLGTWDQIQMSHKITNES